ncbi:chorismate synthase [candidate division KSB1 bacterium]|nr:MAG: chorismate synthase [candidate division KSB1 bacterium]
MIKRLEILTAGESHGKGLVGIIHGLPAGLDIDPEKINFQLVRRQRGAGRGQRMQIEKDTVEIISGIRFGKTLGSPIAVMVKNRDWENWEQKMAPFGKPADEEISIPRPGHADFAGSVKYNHSDLRNVLERASARETAMRVAIGAIAMHFLDNFGIQIKSHVINIGGIKSSDSFIKFCNEDTEQSAERIGSAHLKAEKSDVRCASEITANAMIEKINKAGENGDSLGGVFEVAALNVPAGLGSYTLWDTRLDALLSFALMSIPGIKSVEIGAGIQAADMSGSQFHDPFLIKKEKIIRSQNNCGGIEGGISNGQPVIIRAAMKPIPTLVKPLQSVDLKTMQPSPAHKERSDVCAVPAASIVGEAMTALVLADAFLLRFGGDSMEQVRNNFFASK